MAGVIRKTRLWTHRKQGGKIQEVLIQVQRLRERDREREMDEVRGVEGWRES